MSAYWLIVHMQDIRNTFWVTKSLTCSGQGDSGSWDSRGESESVSWQVQWACDDRMSVPAGKGEMGQEKKCK